MQSSPSYFHSCFVPFHFADPAGILFFGHAFTLFHQAFESFVVHHLECPWAFWFQNQEWIVPIRLAEAEYLFPMRAGQDCQMELSVSTVATSSFTLMTFFHQDKLCCTVKTVHVFCNRLNKQKMTIPEKILSKLRVT
jgi:acyl-CoA thioesterase FadM